MLKLDFVGCSEAVGGFGYVVACFVEGLHGLMERGGLLGCGEEFGEERLLHPLIEIISQYLRFLDYPIPPMPQGMGILGGIR